MNQRGHVLLEILVAILLLSLFLTYVFDGFSGVFAQIFSSGSYFKSANLLQAAVEEIKVQSYDEVSGYEVENYKDSGFKLVVKVSSVEDMTDEEGNTVVKKVEVNILDGERVRADTEFLIYKEK